MTGPGASSENRWLDQVRMFVQESVLPAADRWDELGELSADVIPQLARLGVLGAAVPAEHGGRELDELAFGRLSEELGRGCSSVRSLLTAHSMVVRAIARWGDRAARERWLPGLAEGRTLAAFALSEPVAGSDTSALAATVTSGAGGLRLNGAKRWVTHGQIADVYLAFARMAGRPAAVLVPRDSPGVTVRPVRGLLGVRAAMVAHVDFDDCRLDDDAVVGRPGFGLSMVAADALELGRHSVAWGCVGLSRAALETALDAVGGPGATGDASADPQWALRLVADATADLRSAELLCADAAAQRQARMAGALRATWLAKYVAAAAAARICAALTRTPVGRDPRRHGRVSRLTRDAKVMEIIEGSTQIQQGMIGQAVIGAYRAARGPGILATQGGTR